MATEDGMECLELLAQVAGVSFDGSRLVDVACIAFPNVCEDGVAALRDAYRDKIVRRVKVRRVGIAWVLRVAAARVP